jgi:amino acid transporter
MAYLASIAGSYFFLLFGANGVARGHGWTTVVGTVIVLGMTYICYRGIQISARLQYFLFGIEAVLLIVFSLVALVKVYSGHAPAGSIHPSISWFNPLSSGGLHAFATGLILALFIYWIARLASTRRQLTAVITQVAPQSSRR